MYFGCRFVITASTKESIIKDVPSLLGRSPKIYSPALLFAVSGAQLVPAKGKESKIRFSTSLINCRKPEAGSTVSK